jgi:hypothetical protein
VTSDLLNAPPARTWRDIPQPVKPRTMSSGGRWRLAMAVARGIGVGLVVAVVALGAWLVIRALQENSTVTPSTRGVPVRQLQLVTARDGVLDEAWLTRTLALPHGASLFDLDLERLHARLLADGQVLTATLTKNFPDTLKVTVTERAPVLRLRADLGGREQTLLVARDGVVFTGSGYDPKVLESMPWLAGVKLARDGTGFAPIAGVSVAADLLATAQFHAERLYRAWRVISLARLVSDREIEIRAVPAVRIVFSDHDFFRQLARLDYIWEQVASAPGAVRVDLSLGREVPVTLEPADAAPAPRPTAPPAAAIQMKPLFAFPQIQSTKT